MCNNLVIPLELDFLFNIMGTSLKTSPLACAGYYKSNDFALTVVLGAST